MRVMVDMQRCDGNAICMAVAPGVFEIRDDNKAHVLRDEFDDELRPQLLEAVSMCPTQAISISYDD